MEKVSEIMTVEYKYDSEEERDKHVNEMVSDGWVCEITLNRIMGNNYWYARLRIGI